MRVSVVICTLFVYLDSVIGHGYLAVPGARNSMWRLGFNTPVNYNDMGLNCGGTSNQWDANGGKCGLCGDPYEAPQPRDHEAGGPNAPVYRPISRCYNQRDKVINVTARITAHHKGYMQFRLCENNNIAQDPNEDCINNGRLLTVAGTQTTRYDITYDIREFYDFALDLPGDVTCTQCIMHWTYNAGNSYGCDDTGCGMGLGAQEQFINCADIAILPDCSTAEFTTFVPPKTTDGNTMPTTVWSTFKTVCRAAGAWTGDAGMDEWCMMNCLHPTHPYCPESHCQCDD